MVGIGLINQRGGLGHLVIDSSETLIGPPPAQALFSPCRASHPQLADCRAWDEVGDRPCRVYRYALARTWGVGPASNERAATFVMLNPSTADGRTDDPTIRRCVRFAQREGLGGIVVVNAYALRTTDPAGLVGHSDPVGPDNDQVIAAVLCERTPGPVIVAWGADKTMRGSARPEQVIKLLRANGVEPQCLGTTIDGYPRHPLFLKHDTPLRPYPAMSRMG